MKRELRVLVIEDMAADVELIRHELRRAGLRCRSEWVRNKEQLLNELTQNPPDIILSDHGVPGFDGFTALDMARRACPEIPFIIVTGAHGDEVAVETLKHGADDYVLKNRLHLLAPAIERALREAAERGRRRRAEEALRQSQEELRLMAEAEQKLRQAATRTEGDYRELQELTHVLAWDLRTRIRHIDRFAESLQRAPGGAARPEDRNSVRTIVESARQMGRVLDELLTYCRIGQVEMKRMHFSLADTVKEVLRDLSREAEGRQIEWVLGELPVIEGDPALIWLALSSLMSNALKFTRAREQARIEIGSTSTDKEVIVRVADNGAGFDAQRSARLFGLFQRLHSAGEYEGTGLGLANVRRIVQRHGGRAWAEGALGQGASFFLSLPRLQAGGAMIEPAAGA
ncbi:MAG: sensor histidine kinase [Limisphaerales bacterium]